MYGFDVLVIYSILVNFLSFYNFSYSWSKKSNSSLRHYSDNKNKNKLIYWYLAGLIEGDGHLSVPKTLKSSSGINTWAKIEIIFALKDRPSAEFLQKTFGGYIFRIPEKNCVKWSIQDKKSVTFIVNCINGKFRTPKYDTLCKLIDFLNVKGDNIQILPLDTSPLDSNAWLAGFIDANGCFSIKGFSSNNLRTYLGFQLYLAQRSIYLNGQSLEGLMQIISNFFKSKLMNRNIRGFKQFVVNTSSKESNLILVDYLTTYPLINSKYLDFKCWEKCLKMYIDKLHKDPEHLEQMKLLKKSMNTGRTEFNWSHLENSIYAK